MLYLYYIYFREITIQVIFIFMWKCVSKWKSPLERGWMWSNTNVLHEPCDLVTLYGCTAGWFYTSNMLSLCSGPHPELPMLFDNYYAYITIHVLACECRAHTRCLSVYTHTHTNTQTHFCLHTVNCFPVRRFHFNACSALGNENKSLFRSIIPSL